MRVDDVEFPAVRYAAVSPVQAGSCARARWRRAAVGATAASLCLALVVFLSLCVPDVKTPLSIVGSVAGSLIIFVLPALFL